MTYDYETRSSYSVTVRAVGNGGAGVLENGRDYRVGYQISPARQSRSAMYLGIEGVRRENNGGGEGTEHAVALRLGTHW